jgi:alanyl-tRNA synthetase
MSTPVATERLYYHDARLARFSALVTDVSPDGLVVYLDRTACYPTSGGQPHDLGTLADVPLRDVVDEETRIAHHLAAPLGLPVGAMVVGQIDMVRRVDLMQQHTGQHLLSALLHDAYGWPTVSVHFGDVASTLDIAAPEVPTSLLAEIEARANERIVADHLVSVTYEDAATADGLRKASDREGTLRVVTIEGLDRSACGGTHVERTGGIGALLIRRAEKTKGATRLEFLCGHRAVRRARDDADLLTRAARPLSAAPAELPALVEQMQQRLVELDRERRRLQQELARYEAQTRWQQAAVDADGLRRMAIDTTDPVKESEPLVQQLIALGACVVLVTHASSGGVMLGTSADSNVNAGPLLRSALQAAGGRGGGSARLAQGAVTNPEALMAVRTALGF